MAALAQATASPVSSEAGMRVALIFVALLATTMIIFGDWRGLLAYPFVGLVWR